MASAMIAWVSAASLGAMTSSLETGPRWVK